MTKNSIITELCSRGIVREIITNISRNSEKDEDLKDLEQDIYVTLLLKDETFLTGLYERGELNYYIANIVYTQLRSVTSPYYRKYKYTINKNIPIENVSI